jgi:hypothetical protein
MDDLIAQFALLFSGGILFALGILTIGNEACYYLLRNIFGIKGSQPESPTPVWSVHNYPRYLIGTLLVVIGLSLIRMWRIVAEGST